MKLFSISFILSAIFFLASCSGGDDDDPCNDVDCGTTGNCIEGVCECDEGYEGINCEVELRAKFVGEWIAMDYSCNGANGVPYEFNIVRGATINDLVFSIPSSSLEFPATYSGKVMTIPLKEYDSTTLMGTITQIGVDQLALNFTIDNSIAILDCTANGVRK